MPANTQPIFPVKPAIGIATLTAATPITSRANIAGTAGLVQLTPTTTNGRRVDAISVKAKAATVATIISIWLYNGTTAHLIDEIDVAAVNPGNTLDSFAITRLYQNLVLPSDHQLYVSQTVQSDVNVVAFGGDY